MPGGLPGPDRRSATAASVERRALTALDPATLDDVLGRLTTAAGIDAHEWWTGQRFFPPDAFEDLLTRRAEFETAVASIRQAGRNVAPVTWGRTFTTTDHPTTTRDLQQLASIGDLAATPVIAEALKLSRLLQWLIEIWAETEQLKGRRDYVRDKHGEPEALPPTWLTAVTTASATRLPL